SDRRFLAPASRQDALDFGDVQRSPVRAADAERRGTGGARRVERHATRDGDDREIAGPAAELVEREAARGRRNGKRDGSEDLGRGGAGRERPLEELAGAKRSHTRRGTQCQPRVEGDRDERPLGGG